MWTLLLLAATVRSFAHMPLGISDCNKGTASAGFTYRLKPRASRSKGDVQQTVVRIESMAVIWSFRLNFAKNLCLNYYSRNLVLLNFRGDTARDLQRVSINLNMTVGQAQWCWNFLARGPHLSFRNPSWATRINNLNKNSLKWLKC